MRTRYSVTRYRSVQGCRAKSAPGHAGGRSGPAISGRADGADVSRARVVNYSGHRRSWAVSSTLVRATFIIIASIV